MAGEFKEIYLNTDQVLSRPGQVYLVATTPIFKVVGGPILLKCLMGIFTVAQTAGAATVTFLANAVATDAASAGLAAAVVGNEVLSLLDGATAVSGPALAVTGAKAAWFTVTPGTISAKVAAFQIDGICFCIVYQRLTVASEVVLA
jgi:hypothetical protein